MAKEKVEKEEKRFYRCHACGKPFEVGTGWKDVDGTPSNVQCQKCGDEGAQKK